MIHHWIQIDRVACRTTISSVVSFNWHRVTFLPFFQCCIFTWPCNIFYPLLTHNCEHILRCFNCVTFVWYKQDSLREKLFLTVVTFIMLFTHVDHFMTNAILNLKKRFITMSKLVMLFGHVNPHMALYRDILKWLLFKMSTLERSFTTLNPFVETILLSLNVLPHNRHQQEFLPVWILWWATLSLLLLDVLSQYWQQKSFSLLWIISWVIRWLLTPKLFSQCWHYEDFHLCESMQMFFVPILALVWLLSFDLCESVVVNAMYSDWRFYHNLNSGKVFHLCEFFHGNAITLFHKTDSQKAFTQMEFMPGLFGFHEKLLTMLTDLHPSESFHA